MGILQASQPILCIIYAPPSPTKCHLPVHLLMTHHPSYHSMHHAHPILPRLAVLKTLCSTPFNDPPPQALTLLLNALATFIYTTCLPPYYQCSSYPSFLDLGCNDTYLDQSIDDDTSLEVMQSIINLVWKFTAMT
jgi:hypothetical protein